VQRVVIVGKGESAHQTEGDIVIGLNHAAYLDYCTMGCCADQRMINDFISTRLGKPVILGRQRAYRCCDPIIRISNGGSASASLAIHYLARLGHKTISLVGFDAFWSWDQGRYKYVNIGIQTAINQTGVRCVRE